MREPILTSCPLSYTCAQCYTWVLYKHTCMVLCMNAVPPHSKWIKKKNKKTKKPTSSQGWRRWLRHWRLGSQWEEKNKNKKTKRKTSSPLLHVFLGSQGRSNTHLKLENFTQNPKFQASYTKYKEMKMESHHSHTAETCSHVSLCSQPFHTTPTSLASNVYTWV